MSDNLKNNINYSSEKIEIYNCNSIYKKNNNFTLNIENLKIYINKVNIVLGENGAGKSTLLNYILDSKELLPNFKKILLTQNTYTFNRTCLKSVEMVLKWNNSKENPLDYLNLVKLEHKKDVIGKEMSGGERKRLSFALALATNADILLLDEPFANIDKKNQKQLQEIIKELKGKKTIIMVSHRVEICKEIGDYFMELEDGGIIKNGTIDTYEF